jgi:hypothetical protein
MLGNVLGHEGCMHAMLAPPARQALEQHDLISKAQGIAMRKIDLQCRPGFMRERFSVSDAWRMLVGKLDHGT